MSAVGPDRIALLLRRVAGGGRLDDGETAELAGIVPAPAGRVRVVTAKNYARTLAEYVDAFVAAGMPRTKDDRRKLKNWIKAGRYKGEDLRAEPDLPPFDRLEDMAGWWRRNMVYSPPAFMVAWEKDDALPVAPKGEKKGEPKEDQSDITGYGDLTLDADLANDFTVKILAGAARDSLRRYEEARKREDWRAARVIRGELIDDVKDLQRAQVDALKVLAAKGDYLKKQETLQSLNALLSMQDTSFYNALEDVIRQANPQMDSAARRDLALTQRDKVFEHFHRSEFAEAWRPSLHD